METDKMDRRLNFHRNRSEISAYAEEYYKMFPKKPANPANANPVIKDKQTFLGTLYKYAHKYSYYV